MLKIVSLLFFLSLSLHSSYSARYDINQAFLQSYHCQPWMSECFYTLRVHDCYTMNDRKHTIYSVNRTLYGFNDYEDIKLDENSVPTGDGSYNQKLICMNGTFPGPLILAYENQYVNIKVMNQLDTESFTVHWHGQYQKGSNHMDGVHIINQQAISPGTFFVYRFKANPRGTFWYHSHAHLFFSLNGPFIILPNPPNKNYGNIDQSVLMIADYGGTWDPVRDINLLNQVSIIKAPVNSGSYKDTVLEFATNSSRISVPTNSHCINGKAESPNSLIKLPLEVVTVKYNNTYRLRFINAAGRNFYTISVDQHKMTIISVDGFDIEPVKGVDSIILTGGERVDVLLTANNNSTMKNFWIRAITVQAGCNFASLSNARGLAILRYDDAVIEDPVSTPNNCGTSCLTVGCYSKYQMMDRKCLTWNDLNALVPYDQSSIIDLPDVKDIIHMNFDIINLPFSPRFAINYKSFLHPDHFLKSFNSIGSLHLPDLTNQDKNDELLASCNNCQDPAENITQFCSCYQYFDIRASGPTKYKYFVFSDLNRDVRIFRPGVHEHPAHLHGNAFEVLKYYMPDMANATADCSTFLNTSDISCQNRNKGGNAKYGCLNGQFNVPLANLKFKVMKPVVKDIVTIPIGGYVLARMRLDNLGIWPVHCHNFFHHIGGMMAMLHVKNDKNYIDKPVTKVLKSSLCRRWGGVC